jgi:SAM-dependent methyltransferase
MGAAALLGDEATEMAELGRVVAERLGGRGACRPLQVLEAGCGRRWPLDLGSIPHRLVGIDLDRRSLAIRRREQGDLDLAVVADLTRVALPAASFDLVWCSYVLEHVHGVEALLDRLATWIRPGGLIVLRLPDPVSLWGRATRHTPHRVHVWFRRHVLGFADAGTPGHGPYPVVYEPTASAPGIRRWAARRGLVVRLEHTTNHWVHRLGRAEQPVRAGLRAVQVASVGRVPGDHNNLVFVLECPMARTGRTPASEFRSPAPVGAATS